MDDLESRAWLLERFGTHGQQLRTEIPAMLWRCHLGMKDAQERAPMKAHAVYGQIWRSVHDSMEEQFRSLPSAQLYRPPSAPYKVVIVNGTALFPWRYARDARTKLQEASLGLHVSPTRKLVLAGVAMPDTLPFGDVLTEYADEGAEEIEYHRAAFRETAAEHPVVIIAYASNPAALLSAYWGDVKRLCPDGTLELGYYEQFDLTQPPSPPASRLTIVSPDESPGPSFTNGPLPNPVITARPGPAGTQPESSTTGDHG